MKKIIFITLLFLCIFLIYKKFNNSKINYVTIGDSFMLGINSYNIANYSYNDYIINYLTNKNKLNTSNNLYYNNTILNLNDDINNNKTIKYNNHEYYLKRILRESDLLIISIGMDELALNYSNNMDNNYIYFANMKINIEKLIKSVRKYTINDIIFIGYYNPTNYYDSKVDNYFYYIKGELELLLSKYNIKYLDIYPVIKNNNYLNNPNNYHLNTLGYEKIGSMLTNLIENA